VQTIISALEFVARADYVVFGPVAAARRYIESDMLREIPVVGWNVSEVVHLACNGDRVLDRVRAAVVNAARETLEHSSSQTKIAAAPR
jgi:hypothetical protein